MGRNRYDKKIDANQPEIVEELRKRGFSVETGMDDLLVGKHGLTKWYEIKNPDCVSRRSGKILDSAKKKHQIELEKTWKGHYKIVSSVEEIIHDFNTASTQHSKAKL